MELILNLAWVACSAGLIALWLRTRGSDPERRPALSMQVLALALVVLLLLPVISLSDDLISAQGPADETATCARRVQHLDIHRDMVPVSTALPVQTANWILTSGYVREALQSDGLTLPPSFHSGSLDSRPPPFQV